MFNTKPAYTTTDIASYVDSIETLSKLRDAIQTQLRINQQPSPQQRLAWLTEIENFNRDIASMQAVLNKMLQRVQKDQA